MNNSKNNFKIIKKFSKKGGNFYKNFTSEMKTSLTCDILSEKDLVNKRMDTGKNRICAAKYITDYINSIVSECIHTQNIIRIDTPIGRESLNGLIFRHEELVKQIPFTSKIIPVTISEESSLKTYDEKIKRIELEIKSIILASKAVLEESVCNLPMSYKYFFCNEKKKYQNLIIPKYFQEDIKTIVENRNYYTVMSELANGDLLELFTKNDSLSMDESILLQMFLALQSFHTYTGCNHNDIHLGNFLYHEITAGGYWFYIVDTVEIYVPNNGYLIVLSDYGLSKDIVTDNDIYEEFIALSFLITRYFLNTNKPSLTPYPFVNINKHLLTSTPAPVNNTFYEVMNKQKEMFKTVIFNKSMLPPGSFIINESKPYILHKTQNSS